MWQADTGPRGSWCMWQADSGAVRHGAWGMKQQWRCMSHVSSGAEKAHMRNQHGPRTGHQDAYQRKERSCMFLGLLIHISSCWSSKLCRHALTSTWTHVTWNMEDDTLNGCRWAHSWAPYAEQPIYGLRVRTRKAIYAYCGQGRPYMRIHIYMSLIQIWRCRRTYALRSRWAAHRV